LRILINVKLLLLRHFAALSKESKQFAKELTKKGLIVKAAIKLKEYE
jgi:hypothetical protein